MRRILLMLLLLSGTSAQVWAACTASLSNNSPSFGTSVTSFTLNSAEQPVSTNIYLDCDSALSLLTNDYATLTMTGASTLVASRGAMKRTDDLTVTDTIPVKLCGVSGCSSGEVTNGGAGYTEWHFSFDGTGIEALYAATLSTHCDRSKRFGWPLCGDVKPESLLQHMRGGDHFNRLYAVAKR